MVSQTIRKKGFWIQFSKWLSILIILSSIVVITLGVTTSGFSVGAWETSSGSSIIDNTTTPVGEGPGQLATKQILITFFGGGALGFAGTLLQKVTKNRLAEVSILGIGSINILFIYIYVVNVGADSFSSGFYGILMPILLLFFSILGTFGIWLISRSKSANKNTFVIVGIAIQLLFEAISVVIVNPSLLINGSESQVEAWSRIRAYTLGQVRINPTFDNYLPWWLLIAAMIMIAITLVVAIIFRRKIDVYETSTKIAQGVGVNVKRLRIGIYLLVAVLAAGSTLIIGTIALLGIIAPSLARLIFKNKLSLIGIASFVIGGTLVMFASWVSLNMATNIPVGILSTAIIIPFFIYRLFRSETW